MVALRRALLVAVFALFVLPAQLAPHNFPTDDSLFYLQIARNVAAGQGSTFNRVTQTNGYHPLWLGVCVASAWISGGRQDPMLRIVFGIQALLAIGCFLLYRAVARRLGIKCWPVGLPVLAGYFLTGLYGSEAHLNGLFILTGALQLLRFAEQPSRRNAALLGTCLGLMFLARLDNVFLVVAIIAGTAVWAGRMKESRIAMLASTGVPAFLTVAPYLGWNLLTFGHLMPISGAIKSTFPHVYGDLRNLGVLGLVTGLSAALGGIALVTPRTPPIRRLALGSLAVGVLVHAFYIVLFTNHNTHWSWYYVPGVILATFLLSVFVDMLSRRSPFLGSRAVVGGAIALLTMWGLARDWARFGNAAAASHNQFVFEFLPPVAGERWEVQLAQWMSRNLPRNAGVLVFDYPGALAYYSPQRIVPTDGLVGDYSYDADLQKYGLAAYLGRHSLRYYLAAISSPTDSCRTEVIYTPVAKRDVGGLVLCPQDLVTTTDRVVRGVPAPSLGLYLIRSVKPPQGTHPPAVIKHGAMW